MSSKIKKRITRKIRKNSIRGGKRMSKRTIKKGGQRMRKRTIKKGSKRMSRMSKRMSKRMSRNIQRGGGDGVATQVIKLFIAKLKAYITINFEEGDLYGIGTKLIKNLDKIDLSKKKMEKKSKEKTAHTEDNYKPYFTSYITRIIMAINSIFRTDGYMINPEYIYIEVLTNYCLELKKNSHKKGKWETALYTLHNVHKGSPLLDPENMMQHTMIIPIEQAGSTYSGANLSAQGANTYNHLLTLAEREAISRASANLPKSKYGNVIYNADTHSSDGVYGMLSNLDTAPNKDPQQKFVDDENVYNMFAPGQRSSSAAGAPRNSAGASATTQNSQTGIYQNVPAASATTQNSQTGNYQNVPDSFLNYNFGKIDAGRKIPSTKELKTARTHAVMAGKGGQQYSVPMEIKSSTVQTDRTPIAGRVRRTTKVKTTANVDHITNTKSVSYTAIPANLKYHDKLINNSNLPLHSFALKINENAPPPSQASQKFNFISKDNNDKYIFKYISSKNSKGKTLSDFRFVLNSFGAREKDGEEVLYVNTLIRTSLSGYSTENTEVKLELPDNYVCLCEWDGNRHIPLSGQGANLETSIINLLNIITNKKTEFCSRVVQGNTESWVRCSAGSDSCPEGLLNSFNFTIMKEANNFYDSVEAVAAAVRGTTVVDVEA